MRLVKFAATLSAAWLSLGAANASELTLYSGMGFQGRELTVRDGVRDLTQLGFNDRANSLVIRSGRWEVCVHADYRDCRIVDAGEYANLERMSNQISSVREVGGGYSSGNYGGRNQGYDPRYGSNQGYDPRYGNNQGYDPRYGYPGSNQGNNQGYDPRYGGQQGSYQNTPVVLFESSGMGGRSLPVQGDMRDLQRTGFNDRTQSMVIQSGTWEFCEHRDFGGRCRMYGPGEYRNLERELRGAISSVRMVGQDNGRGRDNGYGYGYGRENRRDGVELFASEGFAGERMQVRDEVRNLEMMNFNDRAGSLIVYSGQWQFCEHADFGGQCMTYGPGRYDRLGRLQYELSSMRRVR